MINYIKDNDLENRAKTDNQFCLNCRQARIVGDEAFEKRIRETTFEPIKDRYCEQCGDNLYHLRK